MPKIGYARVSTSEQGLAIQVERLEAAGCGIVRSEVASGATREGRSELATILTFIRKDDELVVLRIDRLARSIRDVLNIAHELSTKGASLRILEPEVVSTAGAMGQIAITVLGMAASLELNFIHDRQKAGIEAAKVRGVYKGRRKTLPEDEIRRLFSQGIKKTAIARQLGISRVSVYRVLKDLPESGTDAPADTISTRPPETALPSPEPAPTAASEAPLPVAAAMPLPSTIVQAADTEPDQYPNEPFSVRLMLTLTVEINRKGTRGRKRAIADIESELRWGWDCVIDPDDAVDGRYTIVAKCNRSDGPDALDMAIAELFETMGWIADEKFCFVEATVTDPATGRTWSCVEPPKAERRRRSPRRQRRASARQRRRKPSQFVSLDRWGAVLSTYGLGPYLIRKGVEADAVYYVDADDRQSAWHPDKAKAKRFELYDDAEHLLGMLVEHGLLNEADEDFDIIEL